MFLLTLNYMPMKYRVHNLREGSRPAPKGYRSWLDYWEKSIGKDAHFCGEYQCLAPAKVGAHVQLIDSEDRKWYIVPMCQSHNCQFGDELTVVGPLVAVSDPSIILW